MTTGRRSHGRCLPAAQKLRKAPKCQLAVPRGELSRTGQAGENTAPFSGRIGSRALSPGRYQATLAAPGASSATVGFTIVAGH